VGAILVEGPNRLTNFWKVALSHQDGHQSAVALLLKASLIQVSDYRLLGASCYNINDWYLGQILSLSLVLIELLVPDKMVFM
jgi:hypothetical protein